MCRSCAGVVVGVGDACESSESKSPTSQMPKYLVGIPHLAHCNITSSYNGTVPFVSQKYPMSEGNLFLESSGKVEAGELFLQPEQDAVDTPYLDEPRNFFGEGGDIAAAAAAAAAPMQSPSSAARIGYVLIGVGVMGLLIFVTLIIMWTRERSLHSPKRKYDGQSKRKVAPLDFPESPRVVIVEEEEVDDDGGGDEGTDNGHNQMQIV